ncbi:MAG TPA: cytochrome P450 [Myxococcota bacterium]|nr:cytochrome P450 [Myxococcota bacterium]
MSAATAPSSAARDPFLALVETASAGGDPSPQLHRLRAEDPVHFVESLGFWFVTRHDDVKQLFNDPENATQNRRAWEHYAPAPDGTLVRWLQEESLASKGPAEHARFRRLFNGALTPRAVRRMDAQIREVVERFAAPLRGRRGEVIDLLGDFTNPIPNTVISRIFGVRAGADEARFRDLAQEMIRAFFPFAPPEGVAKAEQALQEMSPWIRRMIAERRHELREDLISDLLRAQGEGEPITDDEIVMLVSILIGAGSETTNLGGLVMIQTLLEHPDQLARVRADRSLVPKAVNEIMRFAFGGPAGMMRYAVRDFTLRGKSIRKGQMLMLALGGANRDPAVFPSPDVLDFDRDNRELLIFGNGPHYCLGANLARQEMGCMLDAALDIVTPGSRVREDLQRFQPMGIFRRPLNLPVEIA